MKIKKAYVLGTKVDKSLSPTIFNYWFKKYNINATYGYKKIEERKFKKEIKKILKEECLCGLNVTIPFKEKIINDLDNIDGPGRAIGAVNCITIKKNKKYGSNTDWLGFRESITKTKTNNILKKNKNKKILLIGYGGVSKAILYSLLSHPHTNKKNILVFNRSKKTIKISKSLYKKTLSLKKITNYLGEAFFIINTTPKNVFSDLKIKKINKVNIVFDAVYKPKETGFLKHFVEAKIKIYGIDMLVNQAKPCFFKWFGINPTSDKKLNEILLKKISK